MALSIVPSRQRLEAAVRCHAPKVSEPLTVRLLAALYLDHCRATYRTRHAAGLLTNTAQAFAVMEAMYGDELVATLGPVEFLATRAGMVEQGWLASTVANRMSRLRHAFRWAYSLKLIEPPVLQALLSMPPMRYGDAPPSEDVRPVDLDVFEATVAVMRPETRALLRCILLGVMRPGEACDMKGSEIRQQSPDLWLYEPTDHKGRWKNLKRTIYLGPQCIMLLQSRMRPGHLFTTQSGRPWSTKLLDGAVRKACRRARQPHWAPNRLRHTAATLIREHMGLEAASASLGHRMVETSQIYAEKSGRLARDVALKYG